MVQCVFVRVPTYSPRSGLLGSGACMHIASVSHRRQRSFFGCIGWHCLRVVHVSHVSTRIVFGDLPLWKVKSASLNMCVSAALSVLSILQNSTVLVAHR
jgi:hypothetical protein